MRLLLLFVLLLLAPSCLANGPGTVLYPSHSADEFIGYGRVIRLEHAGSANGTLLATFEHVSKDPKTPFIIRRSLDDGATWQDLSKVRDGETSKGHPWHVMYQPFLFELPRTLGRYPAGTLLLAGNVVNKDSSATHFQMWRSADHGAHWQYVNTFQVGGGAKPGRGIWEPFLDIDNSGKLVCYFSDERLWQTYSQFIGHITSSDGGNTWGPEFRDVASPNQLDRPGMVTIAHLPNGSRLMSYEVCGPQGCTVRVKDSPDGNIWGKGPDDLGDRPLTTDGRYLTGSPYIAWVPTGGPNGRVLLSANAERLDKTGTLAPESAQVLFCNSDMGRGPWSWMPAPFRVDVVPPGSVSPNYSPHLLPSRNGKSVRMTTASRIGKFGQLRTQWGTTAALPFKDNFSLSSDAGWLVKSGEWKVSDGSIHSIAKGSADTILAGSTAWTNYLVSVEVRFDSPGKATLLYNVTDPTGDPQLFNGYGVSMDSVASVMEYSTFGPQATKPMDLHIPEPGRIEIGRWYRMQAQVKNGSLVGRIDNMVDPTKQPSSSFFVAGIDNRSGLIGLRTEKGQMSWRNISVTEVNDDAKH